MLFICERYLFRAMLFDAACPFQFKLKSCIYTTHIQYKTATIIASVDLATKWPTILSIHTTYLAAATHTFGCKYLLFFFSSKKQSYSCEQTPFYMRAELIGAYAQHRHAANKARRFIAQYYFVICKNACHAS